VKRTPIARMSARKAASLTVLPYSTLTPGEPWGRRAAARRKPLRAVSARRQAENRKRRKLAAELYQERPRCSVPWCPDLADDIHEILSRARSGGIITDPGLWVPLCRRCHDLITFTPESELGWAYEAGVLRHSWDAAGGAALWAPTRPLP
jgi:hypothetical protein